MADTDTAVADAPPILTTPDAPPADTKAEATNTVDISKVADAEITYTLELPEGSALDATAPERIAAYAKAHGLSQAAAADALNLVHTETAATVQRALGAHQRQVQEWRAATLADPALGATEQDRKAKVSKGQAVLTRFVADHPERRAQLDDFLVGNGFGNHPGAVALLAWLGDKMGEGTVATNGGKADAQPTAAQKLYPNMNP